MIAATPPPELDEVCREATCLADLAAVNAAMDTLAAAVTARLAGSNPLVLGVMTGGVVPLAMLLERLRFPLQVDYTHATRYGAKTAGGQLSWVRPLPDGIAGRTVLLVDDILDLGVTLAALVAACRAAGAREVLTAVMVTKDLPRRDGLERADFSALTLPDAYLFGCGMDYKTYLRNAPGIFAVKGTA